MNYYLWLIQQWKLKKYLNLFNNKLSFVPHGLVIFKKKKKIHYYR